MNVAPNPMFPERTPNMFERGFAPSIPGNKGPLRFEEGVATDTDIPFEFSRGAYGDTAGLSPFTNSTSPAMFFKYPEETMRERAHVGSSSWIEAPDVLGEFVQGSMAGDGMPQFEYSFNSGAHVDRMNPTVVFD